MERKKDTSLFSQIPAVDSLLEHPDAKSLLEKYARTFVTNTIRERLEGIRETLRRGGEKGDTLDLSPEGILRSVEELIRRKREPSLRRLINATGILLHTNIGRSLLADDAIEAMMRVAEAPCNLELELDNGKRGHRDVHVEELLCRITGAEAATVVNNNAAAVMLCLNTMAEGKDVIISRGQLVEIGGSFRLPDVVTKSGARLVEVGTTNRTYLADYEKAMTKNTGALLCCHPSNFIVVGFTTDVPIEDLVELGARHGLPVVYDLGSGALVDLSEYGLEKEPMVQESVGHGVDLITFSGDKLLGGPQAGIIVGKKDCLEKIKGNPLKRALRIDKCTMAALEATLQIYLTEPDLSTKLPIVWLLTRTIEEIEEAASKIVKGLSAKLRDRVEISIESGLSRVGGGSLPMESLPTKLIALKPVHISPDELAARLRDCPLPILGRIQQDTIFLDVRTIRKHEEDEVREALLNLNYD
ncbi:MAG: L-seryl-tRNA(Sec) selenium transferase [Gemmatimonadota bacterium]|nr:MAG: L-seryl-tRNA(Sec) selenium transferase [Gemmatimonadota bacterium]